MLAALTRLRLLASHPRLYDRAVAGRVVEAARGCSSCSRSCATRATARSCSASSRRTSRSCASELDRAGIRYLYLDGAHAGARSARSSSTQFQAGEADVFLISLKAGGTGLNLTAADYVIHLDPWWNPAVEDQATDRAHRIGQTRPVTVYRLIARGTIEERILAMHADKRALVTGVLDGTDAAAKLSTRDLLALIGEVASA